MAPSELRTTEGRRHSRDQGTWTASRCNRLLRQLRLHIQNLRHKPTDTDVRNEPTLKRKRLEELRTPIPKRARRKYKSRHRREANGRGPLAELPPNVATPPRGLRKMGETRPSAQFSSPSGMACPTPIRPHDRLDSSCTTPREDQKATKRQLNASMDNLDSALPCSVLIPWVETLLQSSTSADMAYDSIRDMNETSNTTRDVLNKSLIGMCLRRIPDCIAEVQHWDREESAEAGTWTVWDDANAEMAMYQEVQDTFESCHDGWLPFRQLVRAHSIQIIADATTEGLVKSSTVMELAKLCAKFGCYDEAANLLKTATKDILQGEGVEDEKRKLTTAPFCHKPGRHIWSLMCWAGDDLLHENHVSVAELYSTRATTPLSMTALLGKSFWKHSLASITHRECSRKICSFVASALVQLALPSAGGSWSKEVVKERTMVSITAGLTAAATTGNCPKVQRRVIHILDAAIADYRANAPRSLKAERSGLYLLTLARHIAFGLDGSGFDHLRSQSTEELDSIGPQSDPQITYRQTMALTCSTARACTETTKIASHEILDKLRSLLEPISFPAWFHSGLQTDGAFILAQKTKDLRDLAYAENLTSAPGLETSKTGTTMFSGWKWETGISEWVPVTTTGTTTQNVSRCLSTEPTAEAAPDDSINEAQQFLMQPPKRPKAKNLQGRHRHSEGCWGVAAETDKLSVDIREHDSNSRNYARPGCHTSKSAPNSSGGLLAAPRRILQTVAHARSGPCTTRVATLAVVDSMGDANLSGLENPSLSHVAVSHMSRTRASWTELRGDVSTNDDQNTDSDHDALELVEPSIDDFTVGDGVVEHRNKRHDTTQALKARKGRNASEQQQNLLLAGDGSRIGSTALLDWKSRRQHLQPLRRTVSLSSQSRKRSIAGCNIGSDDRDELS